MFTVDEQGEIVFRGRSQTQGSSHEDEYLSLDLNKDLLSTSDELSLDTDLGKYYQ